MPVSPPSNQQNGRSQLFSGTLSPCSAPRFNGKQGILQNKFLFVQGSPVANRESQTSILADAKQVRAASAPRGARLRAVGAGGGLELQSHTGRFLHLPGLGPRHTGLELHRWLSFHLLKILFCFPLLV